MQEIGDICDCRRPANTVDTTYCDPRKIMHLFSLFNVDRDSFQKTVKGGNGGVLNKVFSLQCRRIFGGRNLFRGS